MLYEISIIYFNLRPSDNGRSSDIAHIYGKDNAKEFCRGVAQAENVLEVVAIDAMSGEIIVQYDGDKKVWEEE